MTRGARKPICCCKDGDTIDQPPVVLPFADAVARIQAFGPCALAGTGAALAHEKLGDGFALSDHPPARCAMGGAAGADACRAPKDVPGPLYLRAPDAKLPGGKALV